VLCPPLEAFPFPLDAFYSSGTGVLKALPMHQLTYSVNDAKWSGQKRRLYQKRNKFLSTINYLFRSINSFHNSTTN